MKKILTLIGLFCFSLLIVNAQDPIQHDAEHYVLLSQHQDRWEAEDKDIDDIYIARPPVTNLAIFTVILFTIVEFLYPENSSLGWLGFAAGAAILGITSDYKLKDEFILIVDKLSGKEDFSAKRFGLRYINRIVLNDNSFFNWDEYLNPELLSMFNVSENNNLLSRAFSNVVQQFNSGMLLNFQYGMHNPDFPSRIRQKLFILDYDAYFQGLISCDEVKDHIDLAHESIENLYEKSITQNLRELMEEEKDE